MPGSRDETWSLVRRISWLCDTLGYCRTRSLERVGVGMSAPEQHSTVTPASHDHEQENKTVAEKEPKTSESWNLSLEQRAFIDLLTGDDKQKQ